MILKEKFSPVTFISCHRKGTGEKSMVLFKNLLMNDRDDTLKSMQLEEAA